MDNGIQRVGIVGVGRMGETIALALVDAQVAVLLKSTRSRSEVLNQLSKRFSRTHKQLTESEVAAAFSMTRILSSYEGLAEADLVIECVPEDLSVKHTVFQALEKVCGTATIFATNTSSLNVEELAQVTKRPDRFLGLHFFNPADKMPLVEMISLPSTEQNVKDRASEFLQRIGKHPVQVANVSGFIVNRLLFAMMGEAIRLLQAQVASREDIDAAMKLGSNHPMGPLELADFIGLDICHQILTQIAVNGDSFYESPSLLQQMVQRGELGRKTGRGFYEYAQTAV